MRGDARSSRRRWWTTRSTSTTGARWTASSSRTHCGGPPAGATTEEWTVNKVQGQSEDRSEEVRDREAEGSGNSVKPSRDVTWCAVTLWLLAARLRAGRARRAAAGADRHASDHRARSKRRGDSGCARATSQAPRTDAAAIVRDGLVSDGQGVAIARGPRRREVRDQGELPGFETKTVTDVRVRAGENRREVTLAIQKLDQRCRSGATRRRPPPIPTTTGSARCCRRNRSTRCPTIPTRWKRC